MVVQLANAPLPVAPAVGALSWLLLVLVDIPAVQVPAVFVHEPGCASFHQQHGGHSNCMRFLVRTVHTVQQTVFWGRLSCACCCATTGALVGACRKLWSSPVAVLVGVAQCLVRLWIHVCIIQGGFWMNYYDFLRDWEDSSPEVDSRRSLHTWPMRKWPCSSSTVAVACVLGFAGDAFRAVFPMMPAIFLLLSSCTWKSVHYFYEPSVFSAFPTVEILR